MKKISYYIISIIFIFSIYSCAGYNPIFNSSKFKFNIEEYKIEGDKKLGRQIYSKLYNLSKSNKNNPDTKNFVITIKSTKEKNATAINSSGKVLEYKMTINVNILIKDYFTDNKILNHKFNSFSSYNVQKQHSETVKLEIKTIENILNKIFQDLLIKMSEKITN
jgi:hypothetical protein